MRNVDYCRRWAQLSGRCGVQLVRLLSAGQTNVYQARPLEFDTEGATQPAGDQTVDVLNLAEPANQAGQLAAGTEAMALDVEGRWVICVRGAAAGAVLAKVTSAQGSCAYTLLEQIPAGVGQFADRTGAAAFTAWNLAELSLGNGSAVDVGTLVLATPVASEGTPPTVRWVFDHPVYAKYLD